MLSKVTQLRVFTLSIVGFLLVTSPTYAQEQPESIDQGAFQADDDLGQPQSIDQPTASGSFSQPKALGRQSSGGSMGGPKTDTLNKIRDLLNNEARFGQTPGNNPVLADLESLVQKYSVVNLPKVTVTNLGPGTVQIEKPNGTVIPLGPRKRVTLSIPAGMTNLVAMNNFSQVRIRHAGNGTSRFWDGDDNRFSILQSRSQELEVTMGRNLQNYHIEP